MSDVTEDRVATVTDKLDPVRAQSIIAISGESGGVSRLGRHSQCATPWWCEQVPRRCSENDTLPSRQIASR